MARRTSRICERQGRFCADLCLNAGPRFRLVSQAGLGPSTLPLNGTCVLKWTQMTQILLICEICVKISGCGVVSS